MKFRACLVFALLSSLAVSLALADPREAEWRRVEEALKKSLPKTAITQLEWIARDAEKNRAYPEAIRALGRQLSLEAALDKSDAADRILRLQAKLATAPEPMKPPMEALLAHWYWQYFQDNRWGFHQRTATTSTDNNYRTWDLARVLAEVDRHYTAALAQEAALKATPIGQYTALFPLGQLSDQYRPTLFDVIAHEALSFYQSGEYSGSRPEEEFEIEANSPIFGSVDEFLAWRPETTDTESPRLKTMRLFQAVLAFHRADEDRTAFYDADLARLAFGKNAAIGETKDERYRTALTAFITATKAYEVSAVAQSQFATVLLNQSDTAEAHRVAKAGVRRYPKTRGGEACQAILDGLEARELSVVTEHVWSHSEVQIQVTYRNLTAVHFRAYAVDFNQHIDQAGWNTNAVSREALRQYLRSSPALSWSATLPATADFASRTERVRAPGTLRPGFYVIVASADLAFSDEDNGLSAVSVWVSDLALVLRRNLARGELDGFVLQADRGEPVAGAEVRFLRRDRNTEWTKHSTTRTDADGRFSLPREEAAWLVIAEAGGQTVASSDTLQTGEPDEAGDPKNSIVFFTDRAIYRPGQSIYYKGIAIHHDTHAADYSVRSHRKVTVVFFDANDQEVTRATHRTNDYGSFSGVFTAPANRLTGQMRLSVEGEFGDGYFRVEEYKRPKFETVLPGPAAPAKLGGTVALTGKATAYNGSPVAGAKVRWRVSRTNLMPSWCWWWRPSEQKAIAHGTGMTSADGSFGVSFTAVPDPTVPAKDEPVFDYQVSADVIDTSGETRSASRSVRVGYAALRAELKTDDWQTPATPVLFTVTTTSLNGEPAAASGKLVIRTVPQPATVARASLFDDRSRPFFRTSTPSRPESDPTDPATWSAGAIVTTQPFSTDATGRGQVPLSLPIGLYRATVETQDASGAPVTALDTFEVLDPAATRFPIRVANRVTPNATSVEPGETFRALWGTGYESGRAYVELFSGGKPLERYWTDGTRTQQLIEREISEKLRGGFTLRVTYVRENRGYVTERQIQVPWTDRQLQVSWETFRSKLLPGQPETWTAVIKGPKGERAAAEFVATLYDRSLDQFAVHEWPDRLNVFRREFLPVQAWFDNQAQRFQSLVGWEQPKRDHRNWTYRAFPEDVLTSNANELVTLSPFSIRSESVAGASRRGILERVSEPRAARPDPSATVLGQTGGGYLAKAPMTSNPESISISDRGFESDGQNRVTSSPSPDLSRVTARRNLNETAFFFPQVLADNDGTVKLHFTMPEALTRWRFLGFAHDRQLRSGLLTSETVTAKDLMVEPNAPRFAREGDTLEFAVKVTNASDAVQSGRVRLTFADGETGQSLDDQLRNVTPELPFELSARESRTFTWRITIPDGAGWLTYKAVAASASVSDGEEGALPILSRLVLVTESLALPIRGPATKEFEFTRLLASGQSPTLQHQALTVQMTSQPAWYAVMALPYLMEYPYECSEQVFNRLYANALARRIATSDPKIRQTFERWKATPALDSPLEKNPTLKAVALEETPWVREAKSETDAQRNLGVLFDANRLDATVQEQLRTLSERQSSEGAWSWFPGGPTSEYITLYIVTGFGRLRHLGASIDVTPALKAIATLDKKQQEHYERIQKDPQPGTYVPTSFDVLYLYGRSFFLQDHPIAAQHREAIDFLLGQLRQHWTKLGCHQSEAQAAIALARFGEKVAPAAILQSLKEHSTSSDEFGMYWQDQQPRWSWNRAPIETQAAIIEAFDEVGHDQAAVEACQVWLLKQKQTQRWPTTKATADAIYALLLRGPSLLASTARVSVRLDGEVITPEKTEAGTLAYEHRYTRNEVKPALGRITVTKPDAGVAWGSVHWQYLEDLSRITPTAGTPFQVKKTLWVKETTAKGQVLKPVTGPLAVGDELVVRIELRNDRDLEFVHLKDQRGSGTEPVDVLSQYRYQDGFGYYQSTRDTATHLFIDYLPTGVHVLEYSLRVQLKGRYPTGIAEVQCMYAPEFNSHSESLSLEVN